MHLESTVKNLKKMSKFLSSYYKLLTFILNSKSASLSSSSTRPNPPIVELDSVLKSWGLISGQYMNDGSIRSTKLGKFNQIFILSFMTYYSKSL